MQIVFTEHARQRMNKRKINVDEVEIALNLTGEVK